MKGRRQKHMHGRCGKKAGRCGVPLTSIQTSREAVITSFAINNGEAARLRDLGIREGCRVRIVLSGPNQMIVAVDQARVGMPRNVADLVMVRKLIPA